MSGNVENTTSFCAYEKTVGHIGGGETNMLKHMWTHTGGVGWARRKGNGKTGREVPSLEYQMLTCRDIPRS